MQVESFLMSPRGGIPNHPERPIRLYRGAVTARDGEATAQSFEKIFLTHGWLPQWRNGVYDFHHYHSTAHEVLGCFAGEARLMLGGPDGREVTLRAGDAVLLPAGTGHRALEKSADFAVVGAYPPGQDWQVERQDATDETRRRILAVPWPEQDPVEGAARAGS